VRVAILTAEFEFGISWIRSRSENHSTATFALLHMWLQRKNLRKRSAYGGNLWHPFSNRRLYIRETNKSYKLMVVVCLISECLSA
jgi:hypothetical protein